MDTQAKRTRYGWLDVMKLIAIWLMYCSHYDGMGRFGMIGMYSVLGILFFASGFTAFTREGMPLGPFVKEKLLRLMVPYFAFGVGTLAVRVFLLELSLGDIIAWMRGLLWGSRNVCPLAAMWFLPCLLCMSVYYHVLQRLLCRPALVLAASAAVSLAVKLIHEGPVLPWGLDMGGRFLIYYALGDAVSRLWRRHAAAGRSLSRPAKAALALGVTASIYILYVNFYYGLNYFPSLLGVAQPPFIVSALITFLYQCSAAVCAACAGLVLQKVPLLCRMGRSTLVLCGTEQLVKVILPMLAAALGLAMPDSGSQVGGAVMALQAGVMIAAAFAAFAMPIEKYFPWVLGRFGKAPALKPAPVLPPEQGAGEAGPDA